MNAQLSGNADVNIKGLFTLLEGWNESISTVVIDRLLKLVDAYWPDITNNMQILIDAPQTLSTNLLYAVNFLISKAFCYYHMQDYYNSLNYALQSGPLFNLDEDSFYVKAMINTCIDQYKESRKANIEDADIPEGIRTIVDFIFSQSLQNRNISQLLGISIECNRLDLLEKALRASSNTHDCLYSILHLIEEFQYPMDVQTKVLKLLQQLFIEENDRFGVFFCLLHQHDIHSLSALLVQCSEETKDIAFQMAFLLFELDDINLCKAIRADFPKQLLEDEHSTLSQVNSILTGKVSKELYSSFITRRTHHDNRLLEDYMHNLSWEDTSVQAAMLITNALTSLGGSNEFVINHSSWIKHAENWTKYSIISSFALSQYFSPEKSIEAMQNYLASDKEEEQGGGIYGYCVCHMGEGDSIDSTVLARMRRIIQENGDKEMLVHAAALGLGLIYYGSMNQGLAEDIFALINDKPFVGLGAGIALGLIYCGNSDSFDQVEESIREYYIPLIRETQHDRIAVGLSLGIALMFAETGTRGMSLLQEMLNDNHQYIRMAAVLGLGLAFVGQHQNHSVISLLLKSIASDVSENVRRNAVIALGFLYVNNPEAFIPTALLLLQSYHTHIRYAAAVISGMICAGSGNKQLAEAMLKLMDDSEDFVIQGAAIGLGALFMECNEKLCPESKQYRTKIQVLLNNEGFAGAKRSDSLLRRQGALFGAGLLDAGGRNMVLQLHTPYHFIRKEAIICTFLACQVWEWYPLFHLIIHSLQPTGLLAIDSSLKLPRDLYVKCMREPSVYAYVEPSHKEEDEKKGKGSSVQFSFQKNHPMQLTLTRSLRRSSTFGSKRLESEKKSEAVAEPVKEEKKEEEVKKEEEKKEEVKEPSEFTVLNGNRITKQQMRDLVLPNQPYQFLLDPLQVKENDSVMGIMIVRKNPDHYVSYLDLKHDDGLPEQKCPEPFIYVIPPEPVSN